MAYGRWTLCVTAALAAALAGPAQAAPRGGAADQRVDVYTGELYGTAVQTVCATRRRSGRRAGRARHAAPGRPVEVTITGVQARQLAGRACSSGSSVDGLSVAQRAAAAQESVFRPYSGRGQHPRGVAASRGAERSASHEAVDDRRAAASGHADHGRAGQQDVPHLKDGKRPAVLYQAAQHAREWITPEMTRRLMHHFIDGYGTRPRDHQAGRHHRAVVRPGRQPRRLRLHLHRGQPAVAQEPARQQRRRRRSPRRRRRPQPQLRQQVGLRQRGLLARPDQRDLPRPGAGLRARDAGARRPVRARRLRVPINYHSAARAAALRHRLAGRTPTPDDVIYEAMAGDDATPRRPRLRPRHLGRALHHQRRHRRAHARATTARSASRRRCPPARPASRVDPGRRSGEPEDCGSGFDFPDDEALIQAEFEKNIPFALAVAKSAQDPDDPVSPVGRTAPDFDVDAFDVSYGDPQDGRRSPPSGRCKHLSCSYRINGGASKTRAGVGVEGRRALRRRERRLLRRVPRHGHGPAARRQGRGLVHRREAGQRRATTSPASTFTYTRAATSARDGARASPTRTTRASTRPTRPGRTRPRYAAQYVDALSANRRRARSCGTSTREGVPHDLGVLGHFDAVVWYLGDNRLTQDPEDELTDTAFGPLPDVSVADREQYLDARGARPTSTRAAS